MQFPGSAWDHQPLICSLGAWVWVSFSASRASPIREPCSEPSTRSEPQPAYSRHSRVLLDPAQEGRRDPWVISRFTITAQQGACLCVNLCGLSGEGVAWTPDKVTAAGGASRPPVLGVLTLAGQDTEELRCAGELHCPSSGMSSRYPLPH